MAIQSLQYCNASIGKLVTVDYNDVTHAIVGHSVGADCSPGIGSNENLYLHTSGGTTYKVRTQNSAPYAYVSSTAFGGCVVSIASATPNNADFNDSTNGSITVIGSMGPPPASGTLTFSINGGPFTSGPTHLPTQKVYTGLAPGTYNIRVRRLMPEPGGLPIVDNPCTVTETVVVGFDDVRCDLELGTIEVIKADGGTEGEIHVLTSIDPIGLELEYRLDADAWQASPDFTGLAAGEYDVQVRYKDFTHCSDSRTIELYNDVTCDIRITDIVISHESAKYQDDGSISVIATSTHGSIEYSKDGGGVWQEDNNFYGLVPGVYDIRVRDAEGCTDQLNVTVLKYKAAFIEIPIVSSYRFVIESLGLQNFDNRLLKDFKQPGVDGCIYHQRSLLSESILLQFRSSYTYNTLKIYNEANTLVATIAATKLTDYLNKSDVRNNVLFADAGAGKTQVFFNAGLPDFFEAGIDITVTENAGLNGDYVVEDILPGTGEAEGFTVLIIDKPWPGGTVLQATVSTVYEFAPYEIFEVTAAWELYPAGNYYLVLEGTDVQFSNYTATSEPITTSETLPDDYLKLEYYNFEEAFKVDYTTGIKHIIHVEGFLDYPAPGGKRVVHEDSQNRLRKLMENVTRNPTIYVAALPHYLLEKLPLAFAHDRFLIDDVEYQTEEDFEAEYFECDPLGNGSCKLRQVEFLSENSDDQGDVDEVVLEINGTLLRVTK